MYNVDNAIILAAGSSSRFAPLSYEMHKALLEVRGEILIERQIRQLKAAGIDEIIVVGYKAETFRYLEDKYGVKLVLNREYTVKNNISSIWAAKDYIKNSYICSSDNYFTVNPFEKCVTDSYYSVLFSQDKTNEWCVQYDVRDIITDVRVGGESSWYMMGHVFWSEDFTRVFMNLLKEEYDNPETGNMLWESFYIKHINELKMKVRRYKSDEIFEFDSLQELREFDASYVNNTRSAILKSIANEYGCRESDISDIFPVVENGVTTGFSYRIQNKKYRYIYETL